jgi:hypothetical protein
MTQVRGDFALPPVLELDRSFDELAAPAAVQRVDQRCVFLGDEGTAHLARARQFVVIGIEFLVQDQETVNLRIGKSTLAHQLAIHLFDTVLDQPIDLRLRSQVGITRIGDSSSLGPVADGADVDVDESADHLAAVTEDHRFLDVLEELQLVLDIVRRVQRTIGPICRHPWRGR